MDMEDAIKCLAAERDKAEARVMKMRKALERIEDEGCTSYKHDIWCPACTAHEALKS